MLENRIRMGIKKEPGWDIFFPSMNTGNVVGELVATTPETSWILDAFSKQTISIETLGHRTI